MGKSGSDRTSPCANHSDQTDVTKPTRRSDTQSGSAPSHKRRPSKRDSNPWYELMKKLSEQKYAKNGDLFEFRYNDLLQILIKMKNILRSEPHLVRVAPPVVIVGDIHGQFKDLHSAINAYKDKEQPGWLKRKFVFLGDYVDRGKQSLEVIVLVFLMKILFSEKMKGNNLFHMFNEAFTHLPLACLVGGIILCMHGGISPRLTSLDEINKIPKPLVDPNSNELACDLMWADPMIGLKGFKPNSVRGVSVHFGDDVLHSTMAQLGVKLIVRGHQMMMNGFNFFGAEKLVTVFTA